MTAISESDAMALQVTDVTKHYDSGFTLDDVTFDLPKGYITVSYTHPTLPTKA